MNGRGMVSNFFTAKLTWHWKVSSTETTSYRSVPCTSSANISWHLFYIRQNWSQDHWRLLDWNWLIPSRKSFYRSFSNRRILDFVIWSKLCISAARISRRSGSTDLFIYLGTEASPKAEPKSSMSLSISEMDTLVSTGRVINFKPVEVIKLPNYSVF